MIHCNNEDDNDDDDDDDTDKKTKRSALLHLFKSKWGNRTNNALEHDRNV